MRGKDLQLGFTTDPQNAGGFLKIEHIGSRERLEIVVIYLLFGLYFS